MRALVVMALSTGCFGPKYAPGSPCDDMHACPNGLQCSVVTQTCETANMSFLDGGYEDARLFDVLIDGCTPIGVEICGDGIDQDCNGADAPCPVNDLASGAVDVSAGGDFVADVRFAHDDASKQPVGGGPNCGGSGGHDVFYKVHVAANEVYYFDTFGSDYDTVLRGYAGPCVNGAAPMGLKCSNDACMTKQSQDALTLQAGDYCVVVDQISSAETAGSLHLHVERGLRDGSRLLTGVRITNGNTFLLANASAGACSADGPDEGYYFTLCPNDSFTAHATTCNGTTSFDTALYLRGPSGELARANDDGGTCSTLSTVQASVAGAHLFWVIVDAGFPGASGSFELDTTIQ